MEQVEAVDVAELTRISRRHGVTFLALSGSSVRGEAKPDSDIDLLVAFASPKTLLDLAQIQREMGDSTGRKVDLLTEASISPHIRERVKTEMRVFHDRRS